MKKLLLFVSLALTARAEFRPEVFLEALAMKETGNHPGAVGPCGERSRWQIMPAVWREEMGAEPYSDARAELAAVRHCIRLIVALQHSGQSYTAERLATCWHYGASHRDRPSQWGQEVANLYESLCR